MTGSVDGFRDLVTRRLGLALEGVSEQTLSEALARRTAATGLSTAAYLSRLAGGGSPDEDGAVAAELTVWETYFFRHLEQFRALAEAVVPDRVQARGDGRHLRLLSAGCASGEEAYTMAMVVRGRLPDPLWTVSVLGVDVNPVALARAEAARFSAWSLRAVPAGLRTRWFRTDADGLRPVDDICRSVRFTEGNLVDDHPAFLPPQTYDVVFCRNALMYLTPERRDAALRRIVGSLAPGGYLFLGHAETAFGRLAGLTVRHTHDTFYFQRTDPVDATGWPGTVDVTATPVVAVPAPHRTGGLPGRTAATRQDRALRLLTREHFDEALAVLSDPVPEPTTEPESALLHAVVLSHLGRLGEAEVSCRRLIEADGLNTGAHYLLALCRDSSGDRHDAVRHSQIAAGLDPMFALPRLRLGLLARQRGDESTARRELGMALTLLPGEDAHRLLLFGGGFSRAGLIELCRRELSVCASRS